MSPTKQAKSKATVARNQNSIRWLNGEKKTLGEPRLSRGLANEGTVITKQIGSKH